MSINEIKKISDGTDEIENPFEGDFLGRKALADSLEGYVSRLQVGATIAIDAEWGAGKSWFVNHWKKQLENNDYKVIYLNAFSQDYIDDPFLTISMEIANHLDANEEKIEKLKKGIGNVWRSFLPHAPMLIFSAITTLAGGGFFAQRVNEVINSFKDSGDFSDELGKVINEQLEEHLTAQIENYENEKQTLEYFKTCLKDITRKQDKPIIFIVDELDRCKPEFSIRLIERIKHFFDVPKVVFILAMNKSQLEESINSYYGFVSENKYLDKFIDTTIFLNHKNNRLVNYSFAVSNYIENLGLQFNEKDYEVIVNICFMCNPSARQLVKIFNKFSFLYKDFFISDQKLMLFLIIIFLELKIINGINEHSLNDKFLSINKNFFKEDFDIIQSRYAISSEGKLDFHEYLNEVQYKNSGLYKYTDRLYKLNRFGGNSIGNQFLDTYYPNISIDNNNKDFVQAWYNYIHLVDEFIE